PVGTPAVQLPAVNQSEEIAPVQTVCARVDDVAASNAAATTVVANKCLRISPPLAPAHKRACRDRRFEKVRGQYLTAGATPIYCDCDFPTTARHRRHPPQPRSGITAAPVRAPMRAATWPHIAAAAASELRLRPLTGMRRAQKRPASESLTAACRNTLILRQGLARSGARPARPS